MAFQDLGSDHFRIRNRIRNRSGSAILVFKLRIYKYTIQNLYVLSYYDSIFDQAKLKEKAKQDSHKVQHWVRSEISYFYFEISPVLEFKNTLWGLETE